VNWCIQFLLLLSWRIDLQVELIHRVNKECRSWNQLVKYSIQNAARNKGYSQTAAITVKQPAATHTNRNPRLYASYNPPTPAPIICGVTPSTVNRPVVFCATRSPMNSGRDVTGSPRGRTASAILGPIFTASLSLKIALSV
jgi:hypothetical protein